MSNIRTQLLRSMRVHLQPKRCLICNKIYKPKRHDQKYCSDLCRKEALRRQWREIKRKRRAIIKRLLQEEQKELEVKGWGETHEIKIHDEILGTEAPSTDLCITKDRFGRQRVAGALWLEANF